MDKWMTSRKLLERARGSLAGGVSSPFRAQFPVPLYFADARGCKLTDVDGNQYIDYALAWGPAILGHRHPCIVRAVRKAAEGPHIYGAQHELEFEVAEKIQRLAPCAERVAFTSSGSEAVQLAMRLARAFTGRRLLVKFEGHYHGWMDSALLSHHPSREEAGPDDAPRVVLESKGQVPNAADNVIVARWNRPALLEKLLEERGREVAAVIMEPVLCNSGCILPEDGYLARVRELCDRHGVLLIFDEIITGFRLALGGAQQRYGVAADIATFGKAVAGGLPLSVVAGRKEIMELIFTGGVAFGGTFNGNPVSLAAARATLEELSADGGAALAHANRLGRLLMEQIQALGRSRGIPLLVTGMGTAFSVHFTRRERLAEYRDILDDDGELLARFLRLALQRGVYALPDGRFYVSVVHSEKEVDQTLDALGRVFDDLAAARLT